MDASRCIYRRWISTSMGGLQYLRGGQGSPVQGSLSEKAAHRWHGSSEGGGGDSGDQTRTYGQPLSTGIGRTNGLDDGLRQARARQTRRRSQPLSMRNGAYGGRGSISDHKRRTNTALDNRQTAHLRKTHCSSTGVSAKRRAPCSYRCAQEKSDFARSYSIKGFQTRPRQYADAAKAERLRPMW
jgi:hypothetical protein